jgi:hypothetical protein
LQLSDSSFQQFENHLISSNIVYLFFDLPSMETSGLIDPSGYSSVSAQLIARFNSYAGSHLFEYIGWSTQQSDPKGLISGYSNSAIAQTVSDLSSAGFNGILLDPEPVPDDSPQFLSFVTAFRSEIAQLDPGMLLGDASMNMVPGTQPGGAGWSWDPSYYGQVTSLVDFVVPMLYNSGYTTSSGYEQWVVSRIQLNTEYSKAPVLYSLPDWYQDSTWHTTAAENLTSAVLAFRSYVDSFESTLPPSNMMGLGIFSINGGYVQGQDPLTSFETTQSDWNFFLSDWVNTPYPSLVGSSV